MDTAQIAWRKSKRSNDSGGACVEVGDRCIDGAALNVVWVRDTKDRDGGTLGIPRNQWLSFLEGLKAGEFNHI